MTTANILLRCGVWQSCKTCLLHVLLLAVEESNILVFSPVSSGVSTSLELASVFQPLLTHSVKVVAFRVHEIL